MTNRINKLIDDILEREGGYSDNPDDPGGPTNYGITQATADDHGLGRVRNITEAKARKFYYAEYVQAPNYDTLGPIAEPVMDELVDTGINCGMGTASEYLQRCLNVFNRKQMDYPDLKPDGMVGSKTRSALRAYVARRGDEGVAILVRALNCLQGAHYIHLGESAEKFESFEYGWFRTRVTM